MSKMENKTEGKKPKISKLAIWSVTLGVVSIILFLGQTYLADTLYLSGIPTLKKMLDSNLPADFFLIGALFFFAFYLGFESIISIGDSKGTLRGIVLAVAGTVIGMLGVVGLLLLFFMLLSSNDL